MRVLLKISLFSFFLSTLTFASNYTLYFNTNNPEKRGCLSSTDDNRKNCYLSNGERTTINHEPNIRMKVLAPQETYIGKFGFFLDKPFFILDGIHLSTTEARTLKQFQKEAEEFGLPKILYNLGYTPILVQFSQTVRTSLQSNASAFAELLKYLNDNQVLPFPNKTEDGFIVLGISQGGILGRYGSYLYDKNRSSKDAPIRLYSSLDSPHQGAVMPRGLISTIDFWANDAGVASAEAFYDLIASPGARDLLIYETEKSKPAHNANTSEDRFLFGDYRKAAEYKGFPAILVSQGQLKGKDPAHYTKYYELNRKASLLGKVLGRAESSMGYSNANSTEYSFNRMYQIGSTEEKKSNTGITKLDFVQGSTYPFAKTMYESLREGILDAIPNNMTYWEGMGVVGLPIILNTQWDMDKLYQGSSTFIPSVSAMDYKCENDLAIRKPCAHTLTSNQISFEKPGSQSTGTAIFGVDPTHPRYDESISGRHIESPIKDGNVDKNVLSGMQVDMWRVLCEVAKYDYNPYTNRFRNSKLTGFFSHTANCMESSKMPSIIKNGGTVQEKYFAYARYDFNPKATEKKESIEFTLPAGWQKVALFDNGQDVPVGSTFEFDIKTTSRKGNWMKAELLLTREKNGGTQVQLSEIFIPQDDMRHTIRWQIPGTAEALKKFRWFRLILNSNGGNVEMSQPRLVTSTRYLEEIPSAISSSSIYPNNIYNIKPWSNSVYLKEITMGTSSIMEAKINTKYDGLHINFNKAVSLNNYTNLVVSYVPGTCTNTAIYFDTGTSGSANLASNELQNTFAVKKLPLSKIINTQLTPKGSFSASRLIIQALKDNETCKIKSISLQ